MSWRHEWGTGVNIHSGLTLELDRNKLWTSCSGHFTPQKLVTIQKHTKWTPESIWTVVEKEKGSVLPGIQTQKLFLRW